MKKLSLSLLLTLTVFLTTKAQFAVTQSSNATILAQQLAGPGVTISNATINCATNSSGSFVNAHPDLGFTDGVVLSSGNVIDVSSGFGTDFGIANPQGTFANTSNGFAGDADLLALYTSVGSSTSTSNDACALEFDIEVTGDSLKFNYAFGSEEYDEFVCDQYADIFAFFISGPNPAGGSYTGLNIALVPGTNIPVTVNTINNGTSTGTNPFCNTNYNNFFVNQAAGGGVPGIVYDGMTGDNLTDPTKTIPLQAIAATVPCQTYHFKLVIGDGQDDAFDSGVFLEAGSFSSNAVVIGASSVLGAGFDEAVEGCVNGVFSLQIDTPYAFPVMVGYDISGTATNGVDYAFLLDSVLVPAGDTVVEIDVIAIADGIAEGIETVILTPYTSCGTLGSPSILEIIDDYPHTISANNDTLCAPGVIQLTATGAQYYAWSDSSLLTHPDSAVTSTINPVTETTTFYVDGELGLCTFTDTLSVYVSSTNPTFVTSPITCPGANDGSLWFEINDSANQPMSYSYLFFPAETDSVLTNIGPGFQFAQAFDGFGCSFNFTHTFADPAAAVYDFDTIGISCAGANDGSICIYNIANGTYTASVDTNGVLYGNYPFTMNSDTFCIGSLGPNSYTITFNNDTTGCGATFTTSLSEPNGLAYSYFATNVQCADADDGSICVYNVANGNYTADVLFNGVPMPTMNFTMNSDTFCVDNLPDGLYDVTITNLGSACSANFFDTITAPDTLTVGITVMGTGLCAGGSIDSLVSTVTGGTTNYTYAWNTSATTPNIYSVPFGNYTVLVSDANNCVDSASVTLIAPTPIYLNIAQDSVLCFESNSGSAYLDSISGGNPPYTYSWNTTPVQTNDTAFNLTAGQYILTATDINGCTAMDTIDVLQPADSMTITLSAAQISCFGGDTCIDATVSGGNAPYTFLWNDALAQTTEDICGVTAGNYTLSVTDANGCVQTQSIIVTEVAEIVLTKDSVNIDCFGANNGSATVNAVGGSGVFSYLWNDALAQTTATATNLAPGTYSVLVADAADTNCTKTISVNIVQPTDSLSVTLANLQDVLCFGAATGAIDVNIAGGTSPYTFAWTNGTNNEDLNGVVANNYTLTVTDANSCTENYTDTVSQPTALAVALVNDTNVSCFGGNDGFLDISATGGKTPYTYAWSNTATTEDVSGLTAGSYTVNVTDSNNCVTTGTYTLTEPSTVSISFNYSNYNGSNVSCFGNTDGSLEALVSGGTGPYTFAWDNGTNLNPAVNLAANVVNTVSVTDASGCLYTQAAIALTEPAVLTLAKDSTNLTCAGYSDGTATAIPVGGTAPYTYIWTDPSAQTSAMATSLAAGTYNCNVTDANNCSEIIQVVIEEPMPIVITTTMDSVRCWGEADGAITVTATGGNGNAFEYSIDGGISYQEGNVFEDLAAGIYAEILVRQGGASGCLSVSVSETVLQPEPMFIIINPEDTTVQLQEVAPLEIMVDPSTGYYSGISYTTADISSITWSPTSGLDCTDCLNPNSLVFNDTEYTATVLYSPYGCETSATATVLVENNLKFFIPNSFSPQGDGINDIHYVYGEGLKDFSMAIYNRIGEKVFETSSQSQGWDGTFKGVMQNSGVYTYVFYATYLDSKEISLNGSITLIR